MNSNTKSRFKALKCHQCNTIYNVHSPISFCADCNQPLLADYDLSDPPARPLWSSMDKRNMWVWKEFLPVFDAENIVTLGEGMTETYPCSQWLSSLGLKSSVWLKDESVNPTGSFKARGMSAAVSKAKEWGVSHFCTPTAGNAGSALAAYSASAGARCSVYMPVETPRVFSFDVTLMGAEVYYVNGTIRDAGMKMAEENKNIGAWDVSTLKEPFRLEGKKTMGYELAAQFNYKLPDVIFYPTGGGTGLIGIWKAFKEMQEMGWIDEINTRMVAVQMQDCAPVVKAWKENADVSEVWQNAGVTAANGLRVPKAFGDKLILKAIKESKGWAMDIGEQTMKDVLFSFAREEGIFVSPEGAACLAAIKACFESGKITERETIVVIQTGSGYKYVENLL